MDEKNNKRTIFGWSMYDWANSAYSTTTVGALMPAYFGTVVVAEGGFDMFGIPNLRRNCRHVWKKKRVS